MRYHFGWEDRNGHPAAGSAGKLLRPALCLLSCEAAGGVWRAALPAAVAIELLHNFTLVHDDVEDASARRHGRATVWKLWGEAQAINAGDGLFALAHVELLRLAGQPARRLLQAAQMLDEAALRLCEGQHRDLAGEARDRAGYLDMIEGKTAALLAASCGIGALLGGGSAKTVAALREYGRRLGLAFQVRDDVLGIWGDPRETGKPASDDLRAGKRSYPVVIALERASSDQRRQLDGLLGRALSAADARRARALLDSLDAREESDAAARAYAQAAAGALEGVALRSKPRRELERLARFAAERTA
jgi:geranylgeranyl diphosphate synthase type I